MSEMKSVWVYSENMNVAIELLTKISELANKLHVKLVVLLIGGDVKAQANELISYGGDEIIVAEHPTLRSYQGDSYLEVATKLAEQYMPEIILIGSTKRGRELAARMATRLNVGCIPNCNKLSINEEGGLVTERVVYGGNAFATQTYRVKPQIACVSVGTCEKPKAQNREGKVTEANVQGLGASKIEILETKPIESEVVKIEDAQVVIVGGRGIEKKEHFGLLEGLAEVLGGQCGYTRPMAEDRKWFKGDWVGLSGHTVKPNLYIGCGNSGVIQHIAGIRDSKIIVAINKDSEAPIFEIADYVVNGDLYQIVPALTNALKKMLQ